MQKIRHLKIRKKREEKKKATSMKLAKKMTLRVMGVIDTATSLCGVFRVCRAWLVFAEWK